MSQSPATTREFDHLLVIAAIAWGAFFTETRSVALPCSAAIAFFGMARRRDPCARRAVGVEEFGARPLGLAGACRRDDVLRVCDRRSHRDIDHALNLC